MLASFWKWFSFILLWFAATLVGWVVAVVRHLRRAVAFDLQGALVSEGEEQALIATGVEQVSTRRFLAWRRSLLLFGVPLSLCNALWQTYSSFGFFDHFGEIWSTLGNAVEIVRLLSLFGLSLATFAALLLWKRPRTSSRVLWCGLGAAFVIPLLLAAIPTHFAIDWRNLNQKSLEEMHGLAKLWQISPEEPVGKAEARQTLVHYLQWIVDVSGGACCTPCWCCPRSARSFPCVRLLAGEDASPRSYYAWLVSAQCDTTLFPADSHRVRHQQHCVSRAGAAGESGNVHMRFACCICWRFAA